jgi:hypothetical protein
MSVTFAPLASPHASPWDAHLSRLRPARSSSRTTPAIPQTIADACVRIGWDVTSPFDTCIVQFTRDGKKRHMTLREAAQYRLADITDDLYAAAALYKPGAIHAGGGRKRENVERIFELAFDIDLKDTLGVPQGIIHAMPQGEIDGHIAELVDEAHRLFALAGVPIHRIRCSGYGIYVDVRIADDDQHRTDEISRIHKGLIARIDAYAHRAFVDTSASDAPTRITRVVGSRNWKNRAAPKVVSILFETPGSVRLDQLPAPPRSLESRHIPPTTSRRCR